MSPWKHLLGITLASAVWMAPVFCSAQPASGQPTPQPSPAPQAQPQVKGDVKPAVACVVNDEKNCTPDSKNELTHHLQLRVTNLKEWTAQGNSPWNLILFLNDRPFKGLHPVAVDPQNSDLTFKLERTSNTASTWDDLLTRGKDWKWRGVSQDVRPSIGLEGGLACDTQARFDLILLSWFWFVVSILFAMGTLVALVVLSRKTALLRESTTGPFSLSRTQMAIWTWAILNGYFFLFVMTWNPAIDIPVSMLGLLGISATTYVAAVMVDQTSDAPDLKSKGFWKDITGGRAVSLHRIQMMAWNAVLVFVFVVQVVTKMTIPDFNTTLLGLLGLSAGTYVGFKFPENQKTNAAAPATAVVAAQP
jgi:hypothetical protein